MRQFRRQTQFAALLLVFVSRTFGEGNPDGLDSKLLCVGCHNAKVSQSKRHP